MKKVLQIFLVVIVLSLALFNTAFASHGDPIGSSASGFELHDFMDHSGDPMHTHIGVDQDLNRDGFVCVKPISTTKHLHIDNSLPLQ